jgi:predicted nucleotidyltransferase
MFNPETQKSTLHSDPLLEKLVSLLKPYDPEKIILFGSRARGEADSYSDYDVVVIKSTDRSFLERLQDMVPYILDFDRAVEVLVYTPEEFDRMKESGLGWAGLGDSPGRATAL